MKKVRLLVLFFSFVCAGFTQDLKIVNAASLSSASVASNSIVSIKGTGLATGISQTNDPVNPPTTLGGVTVTIGGTPAALFYVSPVQINALVGPKTPLGSETVLVNTGSKTLTGTVTVSNNAPPGIFSESGSGMRDGAIVNAKTFNSGDVTPDVFGGPTYLALFGTGISLSAAPTVTVGGLSAQVIFFGPAPCCAGVEQVNIVLPTTSAGAGRVPVVLTSNGQPSNSVELVILPVKESDEDKVVEMASLAYVPSSSLVLSTDQKSSLVRVIDVSAQKVTQQISLPSGANPTGVAVNAAGTLAVVAETNVGKVAVIDLTKLTITAQIATDLAPLAVAIAGSQAVVVNQDADNVSIIDLSTSQAVKTIPVGHGPDSVAIDSAAKLAYVVNQDDGTLTVIDLVALAATKTLPLGFATVGQEIALIPGAGIGFVTVPAVGPEGRVLVVNLSTGTLTNFDANIDRSAGSSAAVYFNSKLYLANQAGTSVSIVPVNATTGAPTLSSISNVNVDLGPRALAVDTKDNFLVVSNEGTATIVLVNLANNQVVGNFSVTHPGNSGGPSLGNGNGNGGGGGSQGGNGNSGGSEGGGTAAGGGTAGGGTAAGGGASGGGTGNGGGTAGGGVPTAKPPIVEKLSPNTAKAGSTFTLTITGLNLTGATGVTFFPEAKSSAIGGEATGQPDAAISAANIQVSPNGTQITATISVASSAVVGPRVVRVTTPAGQSAPVTLATASFTITQ